MAGAVGQGIACAGVASGQHQRIGLAARRQRDAGAGGGGHGSGHPGDDLGLDAVHPRGLEFLGGASEDAGIAGFETHDVAALQGRGDDDGVDLLLRPGVGADLLADEDQLGARPGQRQHLGIDEPVIEDHIGCL